MQNIFKRFISEIYISRNITNQWIPPINSLCTFKNNIGDYKPFIISKKTNGACVGLLSDGKNIWVFILIIRLEKEVLFHVLIMKYHLNILMKKLNF